MDGNHKRPWSWKRWSPEAGSSLSSACRKRQRYYRFLVQREILQLPVKRSLSIRAFRERPQQLRDASFLSLPRTATCPELKLWFKKRIKYQSSVIAQQKLHKRKCNSKEQGGKAHTVSRVRMGFRLCDLLTMKKTKALINHQLSLPAVNDIMK